MRVACKHGCDVLESSVLLKNFHKSNRGLFQCLHTTSNPSGGWENFYKVIQTRGAVEGVCIIVSNSPVIVKITTTPVNLANFLIRF